MMKPFTTPVLKVTLDIPVETIASIDFLFKQEDNPNAKAIVMKRYPDNVYCVDGVFQVPFTSAETAMFRGGEPFYMDTLIKDRSGNIPQTPIVRLYMDKTLFTKKEVRA